MKKNKYILIAYRFLLSELNAVGEFIGLLAKTTADILVKQKKPIVLHVCCDEQKEATGSTKRDQRLKCNGLFRDVTMDEAGSECGAKYDSVWVSTVYSNGIDTMISDAELLAISEKGLDPYKAAKIKPLFASGHTKAQISDMLSDGGNIRGYSPETVKDYTAIFRAIASE